MLLAAEALVHEVEEGNCEYKWKLCDPSPQRFDQLVSQLKVSFRTSIWFALLVLFPSLRRKLVLIKALYSGAWKKAWEKLSMK